MSIQTYRDITFVFGPPSGDRYEMVKSTALRQGETFSAMYRKYLDGLFTSIEEDGLLDGLFSSVLDEKIQVNNVFPTYQMWMKRDPKFEKFYLRPSEMTVELPAIMVFPPEFTTECGSEVHFSVEFEDARYVSAVIGDALKLDWVDTQCRYMD